MLKEQNKPQHNKNGSGDKKISSRIGVEGDKDLNKKNHSNRKYSIEIKDFVKESNTLLENIKAKENKGLFTLKTANRWMEEAKNRPIPKMLFSEFWYENEICILFADTNLGKSILAVQIANGISKGGYLERFKFEAQKQPVLYFDFELSDKQFENRYSAEYKNHYNFDNDFKRIEINSDADIPAETSFEDFLKVSLEKEIIQTNSKILIIDNITYLGNEMEKSNKALPLMKHLKALKGKYDLSILVLAHTPKRDLAKPITRNDLAGSKMLINFVDSSFSIGESQSDNNLRYLKQIKARNTEIIYNAENVMICQIDKPDNFLKFKFVDYGTEIEHLKRISNEDRENNISRVKELGRHGMNQRNIASELGISLGAVNKYLKK